MTASVYLIKADKYYKIGVATDASKRLLALQTSNPVPLKLVTYYDFETKEDAHFAEYALHQKFNKTRKNGEWFTLTPEKIEAFHDYLKNAGNAKASFEAHQRRIARIEHERVWQEEISPNERQVRTRYDPRITAYTRPVRDETTTPQPETQPSNSKAKFWIKEFSIFGRAIFIGTWWR